MDSCYNDELMHYGVKGMKWGVRRATNNLKRAKTQADYDKAVKSLKSHRDKASKKIAKLEKKRPKLEKRVDKHIMKTDHKTAKMDLKIANLNKKAAMIEKKAGGVFTSKKKAGEYVEKANNLMNQARGMEIKSEALKAKSQKAKQLLAENTHMRDMFRKGISDIDSALLANGKRIFAA